MRRYVKMLADGDYIVGVFNFGDHECSVCVYEQELGFPVNSGRKLQLSDVFTGEDLGVMKDAYRVKLPAHDCAMIRIHVTRKAQ